MFYNLTLVTIPGFCEIGLGSHGLQVFVVFHCFSLFFMVFWSYDLKKT